MSLAFLLPSFPAAAEPFEMDFVETAEMRLLYFDPFQTHLVPHVVRNFHNSLESQKRIFAWQPYEKPTVILADLNDYGNAGAGASPYNAVIVQIAPLSRTFETMPSSERIFMIMNHELVHVANMDVASHADIGWRRFFGGKPLHSARHPESILYSVLATPRANTPRWYLEGAAVFMETWMSGGVGRAQGAYDEMVFRSMVRDGAEFYSNLGLVSEGMSVDFQGGANAYLYGTRFMTYLAFEYSPEHVVDWLRRGQGSERYYSNQFRKVFGKPLEEAWQDWIVFEHEFQRRNMEAVRQHSLTPARPLTSRTLGSISRSYIDPQRNEMIGAFRYPGVVAHVGVLSFENDSVRHVVDIKGPMTYRVTSSAWDPDTRTFFYTTDNLAYRDLMAVNIDTGERRMLLRDSRIGDIVYNRADRSIWGLRHLNGYVSLVRIPHPYKEWNLVHDWPYGRDAYELDISPDGTLLSASLGEIDGQQHLSIFEVASLLDGDAEPIADFDFGTAVPEGFVFSADSRYLFGSSFYTGISNIFRFEIATGELEAVSNAETGFFRPVPLTDGRLMVFEYSGAGFVPTVIDPEPLEDVSAITFLGAETAKRHPIVKDWNVISTLKEINHEQLIVSTGKYRPIRELAYNSGYPVVEGYRDSVALGWYFQLSDPGQFNRFGMSASYSPDSDLPSGERPHVNLEYQGLNWHAGYWHNGADFYDLFGPTKRSRKGDAFFIGYDRALIFDEPRRLDFSGEVAWFTGLDTLPGNQNIATTLEDILSLELDLGYSHTTRSIGAVDHEKGLRWNLALAVDDSDLDTVVKPRVGVDFGFALPWKHASIWLYNAAGTSSGQRADPLGNFYFGGFGNNYVDDGEIKRYRQYYSLPGFEIDEIAASDFVKSVVEFNLPPIRFREVGKPGFFLSHIRPAIFAAILVADPGESIERTVSSVGAQLDLAFTIVHRLPMTLSVGYAAAYEDGNRQGDEWMVSLKIL